MVKALAFHPVSTLTIGRLADEAGVSIDTVRFYERRGLLPEPARTAGGYRAYSADDTWRLRFILRAKELGFTLREIGDLLDGGADPATVRAAAAAKREALAVQQAELAVLDGRLRRLVQLCDAGDDGCETMELDCRA
jgi:MerR family mercuric resistance operon transcriptional regulator